MQIVDVERVLARKGPGKGPMSGQSATSALEQLASAACAAAAGAASSGPGGAPASEEEDRAGNPVIRTLYDHTAVYPFIHAFPAFPPPATFSLYLFPLNLSAPRCCIMRIVA